MEDTAQPQAAETEPLSLHQSLDNAADAFKAALGQQDDRPRDDRGRFARPETAETEETDEIETEEGVETSEPAANDVETDEGEDAAEEAQQSAAAMPASWAKEDQELWETLSPDVQGRIAEREGQRDAAVNQKFQESANARRLAEAQIAEAQANRANYAQALDAVLQMVQPQWPSPSMLDVNSDDYDPDGYHLQRARAEQDQGLFQQLSTQRQQIAAQAQREDAIREQQAAMTINRATLPAFETAYPEIKEQGKATAFLNELMDFARSRGAPVEFFDGTVTAVEWHLIADAKKWHDHQAAMTKVKAGKPEPRKAQPAVRPGVTTPKSTIQKHQMQKAHERLARTGSVEDGAAIWKNFLK